ncbi:MAG: hypothetical protein ABI333_09135 [bacterium]
MIIRPTHRPPGRSLLLGLLLCLTIPGSGEAAAQAGRTKMYMGVKIKPILQIRVGDKGYCKTVFHGTKVGTFRFHVKGILFNYFPRQHLILIASDDPKLKRSGVVAGMSGSPCYIHGGLAGALAYGPNWSKRPIAMLTPIRYMLDELKRPARGIKHSPVASLQLRNATPAHLGFQKLRRPPRLGVARINSLLAWRSGRNPLSPWFRSVPAPPSAKLRRGVAGMRRLSVPLAVSGFDRLTLQELKKDLAPYGFSVVQGGGSSADALRYYKVPKRFEDGGSIGVQLVRGAISMNGTGTVTIVRGNKVLAFGHPMANWGEHYIPVTSSWIHMFMPSYGSSYKISTALGELGRLIQDRRPCIIAETGKKAPVIPVKVTMVSKLGGTKDYSFEIFSNRRVTHYYMSYVIRSILRRELPDAIDTAVTARFSFDTDGAGTITLDDYFYAGRGAAFSFNITGTRGFRIMSFLLASPLRRVHIKRVRIRVQAEYATRVADLTDVRLASNNVEPGSVVQVFARLKRRYGQGSYVKAIPVRIPRNLPDGSLVRIEVASGTYATVDAAPVESIADVLRIISRLYHARQLVVRVLLPGEGTSVGGRIIANLPGSVLDSLRSAVSTKTRIIHRSSFRRAITLPDVLYGSQYIYARVTRRNR